MSAGDQRAARTARARPPRASAAVSFESSAGRWVLAVAVLGSGLAFLDGTVVNVALPAIGEDLGASTGALQWIVNGYLLTLASLILLGGSLGDRLGRRRVFVLGVGLFTAASLLCAVAPERDAADRRPAAAGRRRRAADAGQPGDDRVELPARRPGAGDRRLVGARRRRGGARAAARRLPDRRRLVAGDLPHQPPDRPARDRDGRAVTCPRRATRPRPGGSTCSERCSPRSGLAGTTYALIEAPEAGPSALVVVAAVAGVAALVAFSSTSGGRRTR